MRLTDLEVWLTIVSLLVSILAALCGLLWRVSAWHARTESRISSNERRLDRIEAWLDIGRPPEHRRRR